jgi:hypothetical protein
VSTDGGTIWTTVWQRIGENLPGPTTQLVDISSLVAGQSAVLVRFRFYSSAGDGYWWQVDDVEIVASNKIPAGDVCGNGYNLPANQWRLISLPCLPVSKKVSDIFADDISGIYGTNWILYKYDELSESYVWLNANSNLKQGVGYWVIALDSAVLDVDGTATPLVNNANCPSSDNLCFEIPLQKPTAGNILHNMLGHPLPYPVNWANVRIAADGGAVYTPSGASASNYVSKEFWKYTGNSYAVFDDVTPGYDHGALGAFDGFWVKLLGESPNIGDLTLLIPTIRSKGVITTALISEPEELTGSVLPRTSGASSDIDYSGKSSSWLAFQTSMSSEPTTGKSASTNWNHLAPGLAKRDAHRSVHNASIKSREEWYVRLIIEAEDGALKDEGNIIGKLSDSLFGFDEHDLKELSPISIPYLTIVFPHPDWEENAGTYTSDFHPMNGKNETDSWSFEVHTDEPSRKVSLYWKGNEKILGKSWLIDNESGEEMKPTPHGVYEFVMGRDRRSFTWKYH